ATPFPAVPTVSDLRLWGEDSAALRAPLVGWLVTQDRGRSFQAAASLPERAQRTPISSGAESARAMYDGLVSAVRKAAPTSAGTLVFFDERQQRELTWTGTRVTLKSQARKDHLGACSAEGELRGLWL